MNSTLFTMLTIGSRLFLIFLLFDQIVSQEINLEDSKKCDKYKKEITYIDLLVEDYVNEKWENDESICFKKTLDVMLNVKNSTLWAMWIWDTMQSPVGLLYGSQYQLGNYDQCLKTPWLETYPVYRTKYCLVDLQLTHKNPSYIPIDAHSHTEKYINSKSKHGTQFNTISWGACVPVECQAKSISKFAKVFYKNTHLGPATSDLEVSVNTCHEAGAPTEYRTEFYVTVCFFMLVISTVIFCMVLNRIKFNNGNRLIQAFSLKKSVSSLIDSSQDDVQVLHGMRFMSSAMVVIVHVFMVIISFRPINLLDIDMDIDRYNLTAFYHSSLVIDTFFMMSGLLLARSYKTYANINPLLLIFKRYVRLAWPMWLILFFAKNVMVYLNDGPLWPRSFENEMKICHTNWWITFLMLGNYIDAENMCYPITWSVYCDFQFSVVGIIIFWIFHKNRRVGFVTFIILSIAALIMPGLVTYQQSLVLTLSDKEGLTDPRNVAFTNPTYFEAHFRAGPYLIGMAAGYLLAIYKPSSSKKIVSKFWSVIGFVVALSVAMKIMTLGVYYNELSKDGSWEAAVFASFNRSIWAAAMVCIAVCCEYGTVPFVGALLRWRPLVVLSKLSYGLYLVHTLGFMYTKSSYRSPPHYQLSKTFSDAFVIMTICNQISFLLYIFFEAPMGKIINIILSEKRCMKNNKGIETSLDHNSIQKEAKKII